MKIKGSFFAVLMIASCLVFGLATAAEPFALYKADKLAYIVPSAYKPPEKATTELNLSVVRNGLHASQLVACGKEALKDISVQVSDLQGPDKVPSAAWNVRYALVDPSTGSKFVDMLETQAPSEVAVEANGYALQAIWLRFHVPNNAKSGLYKGIITVSANGAKVSLPVSVKIHDWVLPDPLNWQARLDMIQSPESVAMAYGVELWSPEHLALLDKTFAILGEMGQRTVFITVVRRTHFGNEHALVRWVKDKDGVLQPNFDIVDKYLAVATKHLGKIPGVIFYCWEPVESMGHAGGAGTADRTTARPMQYTLLDPETGALSKRTGPAWGTEEAKELWRRFNVGVKPVLAKYGLENSKLFGLIGDARPTKQSMDDIVTGDDNPLWAVHSHYYCDTWQGYKIGYAIALWGINLNICDPEIGRGFGWNSDFWLAYYPRELSMQAPLAEQRYKMEMWNGALSLYELGAKGRSRFACGLGRIGADFWKVAKDARGKPRSTLAGYFPESYWGQLNLNYCIPAILAKGEREPLPTVRSEMFREGSQDVEVRVFIEKAIELPQYREKMGEEMAGKLREMLDDRIRLVNSLGGVRKDQIRGGTVAPKVSDPEASSDLLYAAAAEVAAKLGVMYIEEGEGQLYSLVQKLESLKKKK